MHRVRVHDPGHRLCVRVHVRCRYVAIRTDEKLDLGRIAARQRLELLRAHRLRIAHDATLGAAIGDADHRALPRHPHRKRLDLTEGDGRVVANTAFPRSPRGVVLDAISGEHLHDAVGHPHREVDRQLTLALGQDRAHVRVEMQLVRGDPELLERDRPWIALGVVDDD
jgi:hypothetical protein